MSGIAVVFNRNGHTSASGLLERMLGTLTHRGPDGISQWTDGPVAMGQCLMHTTPESLHEQYPLSDAARRCWIVWDGRLDNRQELLEAMKTERVDVGQATDPELVLGAWQLWGSSCPTHLLGEFAFVIWDQRTQTLFGARDRMGLKPFYYTEDGSRLFIASEAKTLLAVRDRMPEPDGEVLLALLLSECREADHQRSLFAAIKRLPPAHTLVVQRDAFRVQRYWQLDPSKQTRYSSPQAYVEHFRSLFEEAVACRTRSAFPVGSFLSGGIDSSAMTAVAASSGSTIEAFTGFSHDARTDERGYAQAVCQRFGVPFWEFSILPGNPLTGLDEMLWQVECPLVSTNRHVAERDALVRSRNCRVMLDGEGADQLMDEDGYLADLLLHGRFVRFIRETRTFATWRSEPPRLLFADLLKEAASPGLKTLGKRLLRPIPSWVNQVAANRYDLRTRMRSPRAMLQFPFRCQSVSYEDVCSPYFLFKLELEEREAAYAGRTVWYPFLDSRLVEFVLSIPWDQLCHDGQRKWLLRQATADVLPDTIRARRGKGDWTSVVDESLAPICQGAQPEPLANRSGMAHHYVDMAGVSDFVQQYRNGRRGLRWQVWNFVTLDRWLQRFYTGGRINVATTTRNQETVQPAEAPTLR